MTSHRSLHLQHVCTTATLTALYSQFAISLFMSQSSKTPRTPIAYGSDEETEALLKHFLENRSVNEGAGGFNNTVFQLAISAIQPFYRRGAIKNIKHIKGKWWSVSLRCSDHTILTSHQLKAIHMSINSWKGKSGVHWDDKGGCCIGPETENVWDAHLRVSVSFLFNIINYSNH